MSKPDIKKRAERNGKIRRTVAKIEQTVRKLESMKSEYLDKAVSAKNNGETASYRLARSGLNATLTQIKRAKEMLLNIRITAELQKMGETNEDFLTGMSVIAKRISKINKKSDFVKLQKEIQTALNGMEEAQAGLENFLSGTDAQFAAIAMAPGSLSDEQMDGLIAGELSEHELLIDEQIDSLINKQTTVKPQSATVSVGADDDTSFHKTEQERTVTPVAQPFPSPDGVFRFDRARLSAAPKVISCDFPEAEIGRLVLGKTDDGILNMSFDEKPHLLVCGRKDDYAGYLKYIASSVISSLSPNDIRLLIIDTSKTLNVFNGVPHLVCDVINDRDEAVAAIKALKAETESRYTKFAEAGCSDINSYNAAVPENKIPVILVIVNCLDDIVSGEYDREFNSFARQSSGAGAYSVSFTDRGGAVISPVLKASLAATSIFTAKNEMIYSSGVRSDSVVVPTVDDIETKRIADCLKGGIA